MTSPSNPPEIPACVICGRERTFGTPEHPMDAYEYSWQQAVTGQPFGWYSGDDGEICPECMTETIRSQR